MSVGNIGAIKIGGDVRGGSVTANFVHEGGGRIEGQRIASVFIGGSLIAGTESGGGELVDSGSIRAIDDIGPIIIKGSIIGNASEHVLISARGQAAPGAITNVAIKSLTVGGRVERADILAGYDLSDTPVGINADAQIGAVTVGDWIASNLVAGVQDDATAVRNDFFGEGDDQKIAGGSTGIVSKIASILIKGQAIGDISGVEHFGFLAQHIGSFKVGSTAFVLAPGAGNDLAGLRVGGTNDLRVREVAL